jgi:nucleotide-binding universal stress UspA family protein
MAWYPRKCVLVPVDFSDPSFEAIKTALELVAHPADVHALHVMAPMTDMSGIWSIISLDERRDLAFKKLLERLSSDNLPPISAGVRTGDPGEAIADYATEIKADLIVLPSHGRRGLNRMLMGSVAERVARLSPCPVLILRRPADDV